MFHQIFLVYLKEILFVDQKIFSGSRSPRVTAILGDTVSDTSTESHVSHASSETREPTEAGGNTQYRRAWHIHHNKGRFQSLALGNRATHITHTHTIDMRKLKLYATHFMLIKCIIRVQILEKLRC